MRFDHQQETETGILVKSRYQIQASLSAEMRLTGDDDTDLRIATLVGTGDDFTSQWSTLYDHISGDYSPPSLAVRQLYMRYLINYGSLSAGVMPPAQDVVSNTSMDGDGWVRGVRAIIYLPREGELEGVVGAVDQINSPGAFKIPAELNYHKVEWTQPWRDSLRTKLSVVLLTRAKIIRGELKYWGVAPFAIRYEVSGELLRDVQVHRYAYDVMLRLEKWGYRLRLEYSKIDERFGLLGRLVNDYFGLGSVVMGALDGPAYWSRLRWFTRFYHNDTIGRGMVGLSYTFQLSARDEE